MADSKNYWDKRWLEKNTGWDIGDASPALMEYARQAKDKSISLLIPGCGNAHEAEALSKLGFTDITLLDISPTLVDQLKLKYLSNKSIKVVCNDIFKFSGTYDLIFEQTFFCALDPELRQDLIRKIYDLLKPGGKWVGLFFNTVFEKEGPPFGGNHEEYHEMIKFFFNTKVWAPCYNSIAPREGAEYFAILKKVAQNE